MCLYKYKRHRLVLKFRQRVAKQSGLAIFAHRLCKGVDAVFVGTAACRARGHKRCPVKAITRALSQVTKVVPFNEWGTSSRCPACKDRKVTVERKTATDPTDDSQGEVEMEVAAAVSEAAAAA
ncbi:MAG: hypothetical protein VB934_18980, partial [Polyangiaceae bacterium]